MEIPRRTELARSRRCSGLAKGLLGHPVEKGRKLRGKVAICGGKSGSGGSGHKVKRLAVSRRNSFSELVIVEGRCSVGAHFPARQRGLVGRMKAGLRPAEVGRHGGRPSSFITSAARQRPSKSLGGRCSVGAHFSRVTARPCPSEWGRTSPRKNRTTRRSSLQGHPPPPPVCQLSGSASKHGIPSASSSFILQASS